MLTHIFLYARTFRLPYLHHHKPQKIGFQTVPCCFGSGTSCLSSESYHNLDRKVKIPLFQNTIFLVLVKFFIYIYEHFCFYFALMQRLLTNSLTCYTFVFYNKCWVFTGLENLTFCWTSFPNPFLVDFKGFTAPFTTLQYESLL